MEKKICQSCGMPMGETDEMFGTESDGCKSEDYCEFCYKNGAFTMDVDMDEMVETCVPFVMQGSMDVSEADIRAMLKEILPGLKRWKKI